MLLRKRGAGDESPAGAVGQSPTVFRSLFSQQYLPPQRERVKINLLHRQPQRALQRGAV